MFESGLGEQGLSIATHRQCALSSAGTQGGSCRFVVLDLCHPKDSSLMALREGFRGSGYLVQDIGGKGSELSELDRA